MSKSASNSHLQAFQVALLRSTFKVISRLPLWLLQRVGSALGISLWFFRSRMSLVATENIARCYPELSKQQQLTLLRWNLQETGKTAMETIFAWFASMERCNQAIVSVEGKLAVDQAHALGNGTIFVIPHLGNWELINHYLGKHYGLTHMYQPGKSAVLNQLIVDQRTRTGTQFVATDLQGIRAQLKTLQTGGAIGTMPDQEPNVHTGEFASFFGHAALTSEMIPKLAARTSANVVIAYCVRQEQGFKVVLEVSGQPMDSTARLNQLLEIAIKKYPEQYLWAYKRFRTRPAGEPELYRKDESRLFSLPHKLLLKLLLRLTTVLKLQPAPWLDKSVANLLMLRNGKIIKITRKNIDLCLPEFEEPERRQLTRQALRETAKSIIETGAAWYSSDRNFEHAISSIEGIEYLTDRPVIVMTPPLGNREVIMRYLGNHFKVSEYYHPNSNPSLDDLIRQSRSSKGIALYEHTDENLVRLAEVLAAGNVVTLCPDQQPRLRGGDFVPFFNVPALTTRALPELLRQQPVMLVFGIALRSTEGFDLHFLPCSYDSTADNIAILTTINQQLEQVIRQHLIQYRWSDKRFNIRPNKTPKLYA